MYNLLEWQNPSYVLANRTLNRTFKNGQDVQRVQNASSGVCVMTSIL